MMLQFKVSNFSRASEVRLVCLTPFVEVRGTSDLAWSSCDEPVIAWLGALGELYSGDMIAVVQPITVISLGILFLS